MDSQLDPFLQAERERRAANLEYFLRGQIVAICEAVLAEELGVIAASRRLNLLGLELLNGRDEDFGEFLVVDSDTDHLPVDSERHNWSVEALNRKDKEIAEAQSFYKEEVDAACKKLIERFGMKDETQ
jgi:hypothetical protein